MKVIIDIPEEFIKDYNNDKFADTFLRVLTDCKTLNYEGVSGNYEHETIDMLGRAFCDAKAIPDNATNRDVLQIVFPSLFRIFKPFKKEKVRGNIRLRCDGLMQETKAKWLDEPYKE